MKFVFFFLLIGYSLLFIECSQLGKDRINTYIDSIVMKRVPVVLEVKMLQNGDKNMGVVFKDVIVLDILKNETNNPIPDTITIMGASWCVSKDMEQKDTSLIIYLSSYNVSVLNDNRKYHSGWLYRERYPHYSKCPHDSMGISVE